MSWLSRGEVAEAKMLLSKIDFISLVSNSWIFLLHYLLSTSLDGYTIIFYKKYIFSWVDTIGLKLQLFNIILILINRSLRMFRIRKDNVFVPYLFFLIFTPFIFANLSFFKCKILYFLAADTFLLLCIFTDFFAL